jgi:hypothetical protein
MGGGVAASAISTLFGTETPPAAAKPQLRPAQSADDDDDDDIGRPMSISYPGSQQKVLRASGH